MSDAEVEVTADTTKAKKEIQKVEKGRYRAEVKVDVDKAALAKTRALLSGGGGGRGLGSTLGGAPKLEGAIGRNLIGAQNRSRGRLRGQRGRLTVGRVGVAARGGRSEKCTGDTPLLKPTRPVILPRDEGGPIWWRAPKAAEALAELITMLIGRT